MPRWLNNTWYIIVAIVTMGCAMQGVEWKSNEKKTKNKQPGKYSL